MNDKKSINTKSLRAWIKITDYDSAIEAIRQTYVIGFVLAVMHGALLLLLIVGWNKINEQAKYSPLGLYLFVTVFVLIPLGIGFRVKSRKLGFAPLLILWGCIEGSYIFFKNFAYNIDKDGGFGLTLLVYSMVGVMVMRGFNAFEAYNQIREGIVKKGVSSVDRE
ncbi:MAG: hypothetical protein H6627_15060 [Calditrichae bacterium]|nr:hypothetical protein [Calditrichia bacterium]